jgi:hypothetical protein
MKGTGSAKWNAIVEWSDAWITGERAKALVVTEGVSFRLNANVLGEAEELPSFVASIAAAPKIAR